jgi:flagellar basal-body rod modification protein FlgD
MQVQNLTQAATGGANTSVLAGRTARFADNPFLELLLAQLRSQTPLDAVDNESMMQQMGQLSNMEEQRQLNDNLLTLLQFQGALAKLEGLTQGANLIGKEIEFEDAQTGARLRAVVESVRVDEQGKVLLKAGDNEIGLGQVLGVRGAPATSGGTN